MLQTYCKGLLVFSNNIKNGISDITDIKRRITASVGVRVPLKSELKVYSNELFLFQLTNGLCRSFTKLIIILFLSKAVFIKRTLLFQYFVL